MCTVDYNDNRPVTPKQYLRRANPILYKHVIPEPLFMVPLDNGAIFYCYTLDSDECVLFTDHSCIAVGLNITGVDSLEEEAALVTAFMEGAKILTVEEMLITLSGKGATK